MIELGVGEPTLVPRGSLVRHLFQGAPGARQCIAAAFGSQTHAPPPACRDAPRVHYPIVERELTARGTRGEIRPRGITAATVGGVNGYRGAFVWAASTGLQVRSKDKDFVARARRRKA